MAFSIKRLPMNTMNVIDQLEGHGWEGSNECSAHACLFVFISGTMRFSRYGLGASSPLITTPQYQR
jgi:hypothetical protein